MWLHQLMFHHRLRHSCHKLIFGHQVCNCSHTDVTVKTAESQRKTLDRSGSWLNVSASVWKEYKQKLTFVLGIHEWKEAEGLVTIHFFRPLLPLSLSSNTYLISSLAYLMSSSPSVSVIPFFFLKKQDVNECLWLSEINSPLTGKYETHQPSLRYKLCVHFGEIACVFLSSSERTFNS